MYWVGYFLEKFGNEKIDLPIYKNKTSIHTTLLNILFFSCVFTAKSSSCYGSCVRSHFWERNTVWWEAKVYDEATQTKT